MAKNEPLLNLIPPEFFPGMLPWMPEEEKTPATKNWNEKVRSGLLKREVAGTPTSLCKNNRVVNVGYTQRSMTRRKTGETTATTPIQ